MWAKRTRTAKRNSYGTVSIRHSTYNTKNGFSFKSGEGWWNIRNKVWKRDKGLCQSINFGIKCSKPGKEVHHIRSLNSGGTTEMSNLLVLCESCHNKRHTHLFRTR